MSMKKWWYFAFLLLTFTLFSECREVYSMDNTAMQDQMLKPTAVINVTVGEKDGGFGSGVVYHRGKDYSLVLTAKHVVMAATKLTVKFYGDKVEHDAYVLMMAGELDLAVLKVEHRHDFEAVLSNDLDHPVFTEIWRIGAGLTAEIHVSNGHIAESGKYLMQVSTGVNRGDSGGPIFAFEDGKWRVIGITIAVALKSVAFPQGVPLSAVVTSSNIGYAHDTMAIMEFLTGM